MCVYRYVFVILHYYLSQINPLLKKKAYNSHFKGLTYFAEVTVLKTGCGDYFLLSGKKMVKSVKKIDKLDFVIFFKCRSKDNINRRKNILMDKNIKKYMIRYFSGINIHYP